MKKQLISSLLLFVSTTAYCQKGDCNIEIKVNEKEYTEAKFSLKLGDQTLYSTGGILVIPKKTMEKNRNKKVILNAEDDIVFRKLYQRPEVFNSAHKLEELCKIYILKRK